MIDQYCISQGGVEWKMKGLEDGEELVSGGSGKTQGKIDMRLRELDESDGGDEKEG